LLLLTLFIVIAASRPVKKC